MWVSGDHTHRFRTSQPPSFPVFTHSTRRKHVKEGFLCIPVIVLSGTCGSRGSRAAFLKTGVLCGSENLAVLPNHSSLFVGHYKLCIFLSMPSELMCLFLLPAYFSYPTPAACWALTDSHWWENHSLLLSRARFLCVKDRRIGKNNPWHPCWASGSLHRDPQTGLRNGRKEQTRIFFLQYFKII